MEIETIGYGAFYSHNEMDMIKTLKDYVGDSILIDVRAKPYGALNYPTLKKEISKYHSVKEFGNTENIDLKFFEVNNKNLELGIKRIIELVQRHKTNKIILMCAEGNANKCHRVHIANKLAKKFGVNEINHLNSPEVNKRDLQKKLIL